MKKVYVLSDNVISPLGMNSEENFDNLRDGNSGLHYLDNNPFTTEQIPLGSLDWERIFNHCNEHEIDGHTKFDSLVLLSLSKAIAESNIRSSADNVIFILSTTKGNIDHLGANNGKSFLWSTAKVIQKHFNTAHFPLVISNACISGLVAINTARRLLASGKYEHAVVCGADILSDFVVSGFLSFKSLSAEPCKPFDAKRDGLSLGEGAGTIVLSIEQPAKPEVIEVASGASSNDANHISGPSRTGEGLFLAIHKTLASKNLQPQYISAHGTATPYNDDMESRALKRNNLENVPANSFKGFTGHTLGAAGTIETIFGIHAMRQNYLIRSLGYNEFGVAEKINIITKNQAYKFNVFLKVASGFGGCNAAALFVKHE